MARGVPHEFILRLPDDGSMRWIASAKTEGHPLRQSYTANGEQNGEEPYHGRSGPFVLLNCTVSYGFRQRSDFQMLSADG
jgi:hypothetical protein